MRRVHVNNRVFDTTQLMSYGLFSVDTGQNFTIEELEFNDHNITTVTEGTGSILTINDTTFFPDQDKVRSFGMARINDIGSTTLHAAQELDDAMRVTLQCDYLLV